MKYEIMTSEHNVWSSHRTEKGALKGYVEAVNDGQNRIKVFRDGERVYVFNTYANDIGYKGLLIVEESDGCFYD